MSKIEKGHYDHLAKKYLPQQGGKLERGGESSVVDYIKNNSGGESYESRFERERLDYLKQKFSMPHGLEVWGLSLKRQEPAVEARKPTQFGREQTYARRVVFGGFSKPPVKLELTVTRFN
jgi:hypothetical protein